MINENNEQRADIQGSKIKKYLVPILMAILGVLLVLSMILFRDEEPVSDPERKSYTFYNEYFDTVGSVIDFSDDSEESFTENVARVEATLKKYHELFDIYHSHEGVAGLYKINEMRGAAPVTASSELIEFLDFCIEIYHLTNGEVNIALGAVLRLGSDASAEDREAAAEHCDINDIIIDRENSTVYLSDPEMSLDVGAVGKGYAVEAAAKLLIAEGVSGYVLDIGGNLRIIGERPSGEPFKTGIKDPLNNGGYAEIIEIENTSCVTSGEYERGSHIIDKDTLMPPDHFASVTVITEDSGLADALSTALFCMDKESGEALAASLEGVKVVWVDNSGEVTKFE